MPVFPLLPVAPPVFAAGFPYLNTDMNNGVRQPLAFCSQKTLFRARQTTLQAIGVVNTTLTSWTVDYDPQSGWVGGSNWYLVPFTGFYETTFQLASAAISSIETAGVS